jgi:hypothetical protein
MGFVVRQSDNRNFGWVSKALRPADGSETGLRGFGPRNRAQVFATPEQAQQEIDAVCLRDSRLFKFEIQSE